MLNFFRKKRVSQGEEIEDSIMTITQKEEAVIEKPFERKALTLIWLVIFAVILLLACRVFYLDFFRGEYYSEISRGNRVRELVIKSPRGLIFDKNGKILARSVPSLDAVFFPADLPQEPLQRKKIAEKIAEIFNLNVGNAEIMLESQDAKSLEPKLIKENVSREETLIFAEKFREVPGVVLEKTAIRSYEEGMIFSPVVGYDGKITRAELEENPDYLMTDYIGKSGIEKIYEKDIRGKHGATQVEIDSKGNIKKIIGIINPLPGSDLVLNLDGDLQKRIYDNLSSVLEKSEAKSAAAAAIDPRNGGVLALVSFPSFDNNLFARGISSEEYKALISDENLPFLNRPIAGEYPPGSTIKPIIAAAALSEGTIGNETTVGGSGGAIQIGQYRFRDWKVHGTSNVRKAIAESNDIFFYALGGGWGGVEGLGMSRMKKYYNYFGLGELTGIDLPGESNGLIPDEDWKKNLFSEKWYVGDSYHAAIGQGFVTATSIQLANYTAAAANGGTLYSPRIVNRIKRPEGKEEILSPQIIRRNFIAPEVMKTIREGMRQVVTEGTARSLSALPVEVAGKTGTAQFGTEGKTHSWFIAFAPYEKPEVAIAVVVEGGGEGNSAALPVIRETLAWYFGEKFQTAGSN